MAALADLSLYIHVPLCASKCRYCDFYSVTGVGGPLMSRIAGALRDEAAREIDRLKPQTIESVFIGGGTPSLLSSDILEPFLGSIRETTGAVAEFTIEANPESIDGEFIQVIRENGVDRLSMGVQTYDAELLEWLGRPAGRDAVERADELLSSLWTGRLSRDLLAGLPSDEKKGPADIAQALADDPGHLSVYDLIIEEGTPLSRDRSALARLPDEARKLAEWDELSAQLVSRGYRRYEISNFCRPGHECRHNLRYWRMQPYLGVGPGAASTIPGKIGTVIRRENPRNLSSWLESGGRDTVDSILKAEDLVLEHYMMGLRISDGLRREPFRQIFGIDPVQAVPVSSERWERRGMLSIDADSLRPTEGGMDVLDAILRDIAGELNGLPTNLHGAWPALTPFEIA